MKNDLMNQNAILITGITGHSGKYFLEELVTNKFNGFIRCIIRNTSDITSIEKSGLNIEKVVGDLNDHNLIDQSMSKVKTVVHIYNIHHSINIVECAIKNNV